MAPRQNCFTEAIHDIQATPEDFETKFVHDAKFTSGCQKKKAEQSHLPAWVDPELVREGQRFVSVNLFAVLFAHFIALIFLFCYEPVRRVLLRTRKSDTTTKSLQRFLSTLLHIKKWYEEDLSTEAGEGARDVERIRSIHSGVARTLLRSLMLPDEKVNPGATNKTREPSADPVPICQAVRADIEASVNPATFDRVAMFPDQLHVISQLDMSVTQYVFVGLIAMFPTKFGIFGQEEGVKAFVHLWALIGHLLGIEDRFNICLPENRKMMESIFDKILVPGVWKCDMGSIKLWESLTSGWSLIVPCLSLSAVVRLALDVIHSRYENSLSNVSGNAAGTVSTLVSHEKQVDGQFKNFCTWKDKFYFTLMTTVMYHWIQFDFVRSSLNAILRHAIQMATQKYLPYHLK